MKVNYRYKINWELGKFEIDRGYARYECIASFALVFMYCEYLLKSIFGSVK